MSIATWNPLPSIAEFSFLPEEILFKIWTHVIVSWTNCSLAVRVQQLYGSAKIISGPCGLFLFLNVDKK